VAVEKIMTDNMEDVVEDGEITDDVTETVDSTVGDGPAVKVSGVDTYETGDGILYVTEGGEERIGLLIKAFHAKGSALRAMTVKWLLNAADWSRQTKRPQDVELEEVRLLRSCVMCCPLYMESMIDRCVSCVERIDSLVGSR
jgi:hypothetical protein